MRRRKSEGPGYTGGACPERRDITDDQEALYPDQVWGEEQPEPVTPRMRRVQRHRERMGPDAETLRARILPEQEGPGPAPWDGPDGDDRLYGQRNAPGPDVSRARLQQLPPEMPETIPETEEDPFYWEIPGETEARQNAENDRDFPGKRKKGAVPWVCVIAVCVLLLAGMGYGAVKAVENEKKHRLKAEKVFASVYPEGTFADGVSIGGLTREQAETLLRSRVRESGSQDVNIVVSVNGGASYLLTANDIPFAVNVGSVLDEAMQLSRRGMGDSLLSPMEYRLAQMERIGQEGAYFYTRVTYDPENVLRAVEKIARAEEIPAQDARVEGFDPAERSFFFTDETRGKHIEPTLLYYHLIGMLDQGQRSGTVVLDSYVTEPGVTRSQLMSRYGAVASYTTDTTSDTNRNTNVQLACEAVNGVVLQPGEVFSFNSCTGQRTAEKGYLPAAAIAGGTTVDEVGGGVCQVSSTLFNACAMADLEILERSPHAWPSTYVDKGRDATVNWPNLDYCFRNDRDTPVFLTAEYTRRKCTVTVWGELLPAGESIRLETRVLSETPPGETEYRQDPSLPPGTQQVERKAHTGYEVDTWRVYLKNGEETRRELMCTSTYKMITEQIAYN